MYGSWLWTWVPPAACVLDLPVPDAGGLDVGLSAKEVQEAVREAVVVVREQIEVVEPHVFHNGELRWLNGDYKEKLGVCS